MLGGCVNILADVSPMETANPIEGNHFGDLQKNDSAVNEDCNAHANESENRNRAVWAGEPVLLFVVGSYAHLLQKPVLDIQRLTIRVVF